MLVLHANWSDGAFRLWGESLDAYLASRDRPALESAVALQAGTSETGAATALAGAVTHPFVVNPDELADALRAHGIGGLEAVEIAEFQLRLPHNEQGPVPSERLARRAGDVEAWNNAEALRLKDVEVPCIAIPPDAALEIVSQLAARGPGDRLEYGQNLAFWFAVAEFVVDLLSNQRFIPSVKQVRGNGLQAAWHPWLQDEEARRRLTLLARGMPPVVRAAVDRHEFRPWSILEDALTSMTDSFVRRVLTAENFGEALEDRDPARDLHVAWLSGLLGHEAAVPVTMDAGLTLLRDASAWVARLEDATQHRPLRLCLQLHEPDASQADDEDGPWTVTIHLQSPEQPKALIDADEVWSQSPQSAMLGGRRVERPQELLLAELGRASQLYPKIEEALAEQHPRSVQLNRAEAYEFLREITPLLEESGIGVVTPEWWDQPTGRLAARLHIEAPPEVAPVSPGGGSPVGGPAMGLNSLVRFRWQIAIGDEALTEDEFRALASQHTPLARVRGRWVEISPEQLQAARQFLERTSSGEMTLLEAIHIAHGGSAAGQDFGLPVHGMDATGWVGDLLAASAENQRMPLIEQPPDFHGTLRPYQRNGLSWMAFLDRFGLGACLADDMGLGKTIQLIALLLHERQRALGCQLSAFGQTDQASRQDASGDRQPTADSRQPLSVGPTLLIVPTSVVANWVRELERFAPLLKVHVQHGPERPLGDRFVEIAQRSDVVITTYPLVARDHESLRRMHWHRVALDEAQYIKNPPTKQTTAIRSLHAPHRLALTGTPVENRLSELWSIMEFCNPGYLGPAAEFRRRFAVPVERHHNRLQAERLRQMVRPFILRRVKTDPKVIDDLPECTETKEYATLTVEQAALYEQTVNSMLSEVDSASGIQRRGLVLATLVKLKQICNHPEQAAVGKTDDLRLTVDDSAAEREETDDIAALNRQSSTINRQSLSSRSGKAKRLMTMLEEVLASGEKALIFTQFRQMGHLLTAMIQNDLDCETLFLHGGTPAPKRQQLIDRFQADDGGAPVFVLSLKAGGLGLNLTAANHVFHYDRWWNPAVESQATDRAYRIGQKRAVHVHKFVCIGTLEERIDQMIEQKTELARNIIGAGEQWLTELSTAQLHDLLMLRPTAMEAES